MEELKDIVTAINDRTDTFRINASISLSGNKAAGARARKASLEIEKLLKEYRRLSVEITKR